MRHTLIEGVDNIVLEAIAARMGSHHGKPLLFVKFLVGEPENIHLDASGHERHHRFLVLGNSRRGRTRCSKRTQNSEFQ